MIALPLPSSSTHPPRREEEETRNLSSSRGSAPLESISVVLVTKVAQKDSSGAHFAAASVILPFSQNLSDTLSV